MQRVMLGLVALVLVLAQSMASSQGQNDVATIVSAEEIHKVVSAPGGGDREIKIVDMGKYNLGVAVLRRGAIKAGTPMGAINHTKVAEAYYVVSLDQAITRRARSRRKAERSAYVSRLSDTHFRFVDRVIGHYAIDRLRGRPHTDSHDGASEPALAISGCRGSRSCPIPP